MSSYTPIKWVTPVDFTGTPTGATVYNLPCPSKCQWNLQDISAPDAGRVESMKMVKMRKGQAIALNLEWVYPNASDASIILKAFNSEYISVNYLDAMEGVYLTKVFYVGDRKAPLWNSKKGVWESVAFNIIQQTPDVG